MFRPDPISWLQFATFWVIVFVGAIALIGAVRAQGDGKSAKKSTTSAVGILIQCIGFVSCATGPVRVVLPWNAPLSLICAIAVALFGGGAIAIFVAATRAMGKNWSVVARMRSDHELVRTGPFAIVRHPIYFALFLYMLSLAVAFGHSAQLLLAVPLYSAGTIVRIREEEKLLRAHFGEQHARYVREVPAFIPFFR